MCYINLIIIDLFFVVVHVTLSALKIWNKYIIRRGKKRNDKKYKKCSYKERTYFFDKKKGKGWMLNITKSCVCICMYVFFCVICVHGFVWRIRSILKRIFNFIRKYSSYILLLVMMNYTENLSSNRYIRCHKFAIKNIILNTFKQICLNICTS